MNAAPMKPAGGMKPARSILLRVAVAGVAALTLVLSSTGGAGSTGPFDMTGVSQIQFVVPPVGPIPEIHTNCLARAEQTPGPLNFDTLTLRASCYTVTKTGSGTPPAPPPPPPAYLPRDHRILAGLVNLTTGEVSLAFDTCIRLLVEEVWTDISVQLSGSATKSGWSEVPDSGSVTLNLDQDLIPEDCNPVGSTEITNSFTPVNLPLNHNADIDSVGAVNPDECTTWEELGTDQTKGGLRDPWNPYDIFDVTGLTGQPDGIVDLLYDILGVIQHYQPAFGGEPPYDAQYDRGGQLGPASWNKDSPDGIIDLLNDILGTITQYLHDCTGAPN